MNKKFLNSIDEYYLLALLEIKNGMSVEELEEALQVYEEAEMYEACAGLLKVLNELKFYNNDRTEN